MLGSGVGVGSGSVVLLQVFLVLSQFLLVAVVLAVPLVSECLGVYRW